MARFPDGPILESLAFTDPHSCQFPVLTEPGLPERQILVYRGERLRCSFLHTQVFVFSF